MNKLIKIGEAAEILGVSTVTLRHWDKLNVLVPVMKVNNRTRWYHLNTIQKFLENPTQGDQDNGEN